MWSAKQQGVESAQQRDRMKETKGGRVRQIQGEGEERRRKRRRGRGAPGQAFCCLPKGLICRLWSQRALGDAVSQGGLGPMVRHGISPGGVDVEGDDERDEDDGRVWLLDSRGGPCRRRRLAKLSTAAVADAAPPLVCPPHRRHNRQRVWN